MTKAAETKVVENRSETAAVSGPLAASLGDDDEATHDYIVLVPFKYKGKDRAPKEKVKFTRAQAMHLESRGFVRTPAEGE